MSINGAWFPFDAVVCPSASGVIVSLVNPKHPVKNKRQAKVITFIVRVNGMNLVVLRGPINMMYGSCAENGDF